MRSNRTTTIKRPGRAISQNPLHPSLTRQDDLTLYYYMRLARDFESRAIILYRQGRLVGALYTGTGNEAVAVGSAYALDDGDVLAPLHRDIGAQFVRGTTPREVLAQYMGRATGPSRGKDGSLHVGSVDRRIFALISHLGTMIPAAVGAALASKLSRQRFVAMTYIGDGGTSLGDFHEGLNFAAVRQLPFILIIENNQFAYSTPTAVQYACASLADRAIGYGIPSEIVDGTDILAVYDVCKRAVDRARAGEGPTLIETRTMRMRGHSEHDDASYVPKETLEEWRKKDPIDRFERLLREHDILTDAVKTDIDQRIAREIDDAIAFAEQSPSPAPEDATKDVYAD